MTRKRGAPRAVEARASSSRPRRASWAACSWRRGSCYNLTRFDHPVLLSNGAGSVLMVANCDSTVPAGQQDAGTYRGTYHGTYVGYWSIYCAAGLDQEARPLLLARSAPRTSSTARRHPRHRHQLLRRRVDARGRVACGRYRPRSRTTSARCRGSSCCASRRMWDLFRPNQNIFLNGVLEGRGELAVAARDLRVLPAARAARSSGSSCSGADGCRSCRSSRSRRTITITAATSFGITRYRAPVDAMLPVLAGGALVWLFEWVRARVSAPRRKRRRPSPVNP